MDRCLICHRKLKDENSRQRGIGPTCWRRVEKVVREDRARKRARRASGRRKSGEIEGQINLFDDEDNEKGVNNVDEKVNK